MHIIRLTFKDGRMFYVKEGREEIFLSENIKDAFQYRSILEFKVSFKLLGMIGKPYYSNIGEWLKREVDKFEEIDPSTLKAVAFNIADSEVEIGDR
jgi:hypothetical protein